MIITSNLSFSYPESTVLHYPDLMVAPGGSLLILGPSGCGKTTLLHLLSGILKPSTGQITINGVTINQLSASRMDAFRGKYLGMIFQKHLFIQDVSMHVNLKVAQILSGSSEDGPFRQRLLENLGIDQLLDKKPSMLSQGELQRFSIARAMIHRPKVLLADEPTSALDDSNCEAFVHILTEMTRQYHITLLIASHDARLQSHFPQHIQL